MHVSNPHSSNKGRQRTLEAAVAHGRGGGGALQGWVA